MHSYLQTLLFAFFVYLMVLPLQINVHKKLNVYLSMKVYNTVLAQLARVTLLATRFAIDLLDMLAKLKVEMEISTNTSILPLSKRYSN